MRTLAVLASILFMGNLAHADAGADLRRFFDAEWKWDLEHAPEYATLLGEHAYDDRLSDLSPAAIELRHARWKARLATAQSFTKKKLSEADRLSLELFVLEAQKDVDGIRFPAERMAISQLQGPHIDLPQVVLQTTFRDARSYADYVKRLRAIPRFIDQTIALLEEGRRTGWVAAKEPLRDLPAAVRSTVTKHPEDSVFYVPFKKATLPESVWKASALEAAQVIAHDIGPAYDELATYIEQTYLPAARADVGAWALPDGAAYYASEIHEHTTTTRTAAEIHQLGLAEVARIETEMDAVIKKTGFTGTREAFRQMLRTDPRFFYKDGASLLTGYRDIAKRIDGALPRLFRVLPRLPYGVEPTPASEEKTAPTAYYQPGSPEDGRSGTFLANTYLPQTRSKWEMEALTLHESVPGHHLQIALAQEMPEVPRFRRELSFTAYTEGWGLYAESLGGELGLYQDPYSKYGQLTYEMWRAVRLVVDTGMHSMHWTRKQAIDYFVAHSAKSQHDIEVEVDRYVIWPGQALAYKIGELEIKRLRAWSQQQLGDKFDVRSFHDAVLGAGALPLELVDRRVRAWVASQQELH